MSHVSSTRILRSLLEIFDPNDEEYEGVRDHFTSAQLDRIDSLRAQPDTYISTLDDKLFVNMMDLRAIFKAIE